MTGHVVASAASIFMHLELLLMVIVFVSCLYLGMDPCIFTAVATMAHLGVALLHCFTLQQAMGHLHKMPRRRSLPPQLKTRPVAKPDAPPLNAAGGTGKLAILRQEKYNVQVCQTLRDAYEVNRLHSLAFTVLCPDSFTLGNIGHALALDSKWHSGIGYQQHVRRPKSLTVILLTQSLREAAYSTI